MRNFKNSICPKNARKDSGRGSDRKFFQMPGMMRMDAEL